MWEPRVISRDMQRLGTIQKIMSTTFFLIINPFKIIKLGNGKNLLVYVKNQLMAYIVLSLKGLICLNLTQSFS